MFCTNCGHETVNDMKFCTNCGAIIGGDTEPGQGTPPAAQIGVQPSAAYQPPTYQTYMSSLPVDTNRRKQTQAIAAILAVLVIITMLFSGISLSSGTYSRGFSLSESQLLSQMTGGSKSIFQTADFLGGLREVFKMAQNENRDSSELRDIANKIGIAYFGVSFIKIIVMAAILALLIFIYTMLTGNKNSAFFGQLGGLLAFLSAVFFAIFAVTLSSSLRDLRNIFSVSNSSWVYLTMLVGAIALAFITVRKSVIKGE
jgi:hypothetical protein